MKDSRRRSRVSHERWLISYADFITLLFGLFVVLYAFAMQDQSKQAELPEAVKSAFQSMGVAQNTATPKVEAAERQEATTVVTETQQRAPEAVKQDLDRLQRSLSQSLSGKIASGAITITMDREGLVISLREAGFFDSGTATPKAEAGATLRQIASSLGAVPYDVRVEGHTDNVPIQTAQFASNWELSSVRATAIAKLFLELHTIPPERMSAAGFAEFHPVASNDTAEGRAKNRRVDLVVMPRTSLNFASTAPAQSKGQWLRVADEDRQ